MVRLRTAKEGEDDYAIRTIGKMALRWFLLFVLCLVAQCHGAKILGLFPFPAKSHLIVQKALMLELVRRGHDVTIVTPFLESKPVANLTEIPVSEDRASIHGGGAPPNLFDMTSFGVLDISMVMVMMGKPLCDNVLQQDGVQKLIHAKNLHFDLVVIEAFTNECMLGFAHKFDAPVVQVCPYGGSNFMADWVGSPNPYSYVPDEFLDMTDHMNFKERILNTAVGLFRHFARQLIHLPAQDEMVKKYFGEFQPLPSVWELERRTALVLLNSHWSISIPKPFSPNYVQVGGMHIKAPKPLPFDLQEYLDNSTNGVVYFSMGSNLKSTDMPEDKRKAILDVFSKLKQNVLWKWETDKLPGQPKNVKLGKWLPQSDILAHPNVKLFITHGGLLSTQEAIVRGVPIVALPVFADQYLNANKAQLAGYGIMLHFTNITTKSLTWAIKEVIEKPSYQQNVQRLSAVFRDQPLTPLETAVFWTEYVIRHKGATHMRSAALDLSWYQYFLLDVITVIGMVLGAVLLVLFFIVRKIYRLICGGKPKTVTKESIKKKKN